MKRMTFIYRSFILVGALIIGGCLNQAYATPKCLMQEKKDTGKAITCATCHNAKVPQIGVDTSLNGHGQEFKEKEQKKKVTCFPTKTEAK